MDDVVDLVRRSLSEEARATFGDRVDEQAARLREAIAAGDYDNEGFAVGLEVESYAINAEPGPAPDPEEEDDAAEDEAAPEAAGDAGAAGEASDDADLAGEATGDDLADRATEGEVDLEADLAEGGDGAGAWDASLEPTGGGGEAAGAEGDPVDAAADPEADPDDEPDEPVHEPYMDPEEWEGRLTELPESVFEGLVAKELGVHNAEVNTEPNGFDATGMEVQTASVEMRVKRARDAAAAANAELVLDAMWTIPPEEGTESYLSDVQTRDGVTIAENMRQDPRYVAIDNDALAQAGGEIGLSVPGAEHSFPTILFESLTSSIQPHLQVPSSARFPAFYNAAIRTLGPVLALTTNSPFLPADLYNRVEDPYDLLAETHHELRVAVFEQSVNTTPNPKVRVPADLETTLDVVQGVVDDDTFAPFLREWIADGEREGLDGEYWEYDHKRGTFWRWLRCVIGGDPVEGAGDERSLRIEYRPIPTQPTVRDLVAAQTLVVGLVRGLADRDHPIDELPWQDAERSFYAAARDGPAADLAWVTADGRRTTDREAIYDDLFEHARHGLACEGVPEARIDEWLAPIERRREAGATPSTWKVDRVREYLDDGEDLADAICAMQRDYFELSREHETFADWL